ncbi:MAG: Wzz/FepE/Etk N-terminal domain-containing protein [Melioribacteraceae bacterium]|nr:Wzz/FepE/Etk N-terminal domain-containing protein [Melioribacteraceae bacterium]
MNKKEFRFLDFVLLLTKWRKSIFVNLLLVGIISLVVSLQLDKWYKATAVVLPQKDSGVGGGLSSLMSQLPLASFGLGGGSGDMMTYMAILKSKSLATDVIKHFDLQSFYERETMHQTYESFFGNYNVSFTEEDMIAISFEYKDSVKVAEIVNYIVVKLDNISNKLKVERTQRNFDLIEKRYFQNLHEIDSLQIELEMFQNKYGVIEFYEQTKAIISSIADLDAKVLLRTAELEAIKANFGENSPQYKSTKIQLQTLRDQVNKLKYQNKEKLDNPFSSLFIPLDKIPELGKEYTNIYTGLLLQQKLQEFLLPEYEQTKMQLFKTQPTLQVLDYAVPPDYKSKPKRAFVVLGALVLAFILQLFIILIVERLSYLREFNPEKYNEIISIKRSFIPQRNKKQV